MIAPLDNFLFLLDGFLVRVAEQTAKETKNEVIVSVAPGVELDEDMWEDDLGYPNYKVSNQTGMGLFESPPCFGKRPVTWAIEIIDMQTLNIVISQVYPYRTRFENMGITGGRVGELGGLTRITQATQFPHSVFHAPG